MKLHYCLSVIVLLASTSFASAQQLSFAGKWTGNYTNSLGAKGNDALELDEDSDKDVTGTWGGIQVTGKRINKNTVEMKGETKEKSYQILATLTGDEMVMIYLVANKGKTKTGSYYGVSKLKLKD